MHVGIAQHQACCAASGGLVVAEGCHHHVHVHVPWQAGVHVAQRLPAVYWPV